MALFQGLPLCLQLCGVALLAVGIWVSVDGPSFMKIFGPLSSTAMQFVNVGYFLIAAGAVLLALGFLGCYGAQTENKCALMMVCQTQLHRPVTKAQGPSPLTPGPGDPQALLWTPGASASGAPDLFSCGGGLGQGMHEGLSLPKTQDPCSPLSSSSSSSSSSLLRLQLLWLPWCTPQR